MFSECYQQKTTNQPGHLPYPCRENVAGTEKAIFTNNGMVGKHANTVPTVFRGMLSGTNSETVGLPLEATLTCASPRCHTRWLAPCSSPAGSPGSRSSERSRSPSPRWLPPAEWGPRRCTRRDLVSARPRSGACTETGPSGSGREAEVVTAPARTCAGKVDRRRLTALAFRLPGGLCLQDTPQAFVC